MALAVFLGVIFFGMRSTDAYKEGFARARTSKSVIEAIGEPVKAGLFMSGSVSVSGPSGKADFAVPISCPRGRGTLYLKAVKEAGLWTMLVLEVEVNGRSERIKLLEEAP